MPCRMSSLMINGSSMGRVSEFDFLGLTMNEFMSWSSQAKNVPNKISRVLGIMNRMKLFLPFSALRLMYQSLVNCNLQFCLRAWGYEYNRVYNLQRTAVRIMTATYNAHTEPLFKQLNIMKLEDSFSYSACFITNLKEILFQIIRILPIYSQDILISTIMAHVTVINNIIFLLKRQVQANVSDIQYRIY